MIQPRYLVKDRDAKRTVAQTDAPIIYHPEIDKVIGKIGPFRQVKGTGKFHKDVLGIVAENSNHYTVACQQVPATAEGVKKTLRSLREQEAARLDSIDAEIAALESQLKAKKEERRGLLKEAWSKAHVVTLKEAISQVRMGRFGQHVEKAGA